jgi:hypothetical protein
MIEAPVISSDSHVVEPPNLWTERMDKKTWGDRNPHLKIGDKTDQWIVNGQSLGAIGTTSSAGKRYTQPQTITLEGKFTRDSVPGGYDPHAHMKDWSSTASPAISSTPPPPPASTASRTPPSSPPPSRPTTSGSPTSASPSQASSTASARPAGTQ